MTRRKMLAMAIMAAIGSGLLQGARLLDPGSGPYSRDEFALYGLLVDGLTFLTVALLSYFAKIERPNKLFAVGAVATVVYIGLVVFGHSSTAMALLKQTAAGISWASNILCWMYVFTCYRPRLALLLITLGYVVDVAIQPLLGNMPASWLVFAPVYLLSVVLLWLCLRGSDEVRAATQEPSTPKTTMQEAFSRTRRAIAATFVISAVCGFVVESDALVAGVQYSQTTLTALICLVAALLMMALLALFKVRKVNIDFISPVAAIAIASVLALRFFDIGSIQFSGSLMVATLVSFYVFLWLMFVSEAFERMLPAFFLLGLALAVARISVALGRFCALRVRDAVGLDETAVIVCMMWVLVLAVSAIFMGQCAYANKMGRRVYDVAHEEGGPADGGGEDPLAFADASLGEVALDRLMAEGGLSAKESDVLRDYATGRTARYIADWYMISEHTVKTHLRRAYAKLGVHSRQELLDRVEALVAQEYRERAGK